MAGVGDAKAHKYVIKELIRRTLGISGRNKASNFSGQEELKNWHHTKTPWIRMCSNAVPKLDEKGEDMSSKYAEYDEAVKLFNGAPTAETRFQHVLFGGIGQIDPEGLGEGNLNLARNFSQTYINPFQYGVEDETKPTPLENRLRPAPGITNLDVTFKGDMGALKKAQVSFKCHTLEDLDRMEKYYMYPGFKVLVEWGWSVNTAGTDFQSEPITGVPLSDETLKFPGKVYKAIQENKQLSGGCYDGIFGTIVNFSWTINKDKSFDCTTTISDIGDSIFTANVNTPFHTAKMTEEDSTEDDFTLTTALDKIKEKLSTEGANDTVSDGTIPFSDSIGEFKCKFYRLNTGDTSKASEENKKHRKKQLWIRFGDIVDGLCNKLYCLTSEHTRAEANGDSVAPPIAMLSISGKKFGEKPVLVDNPEKKDEDVETVTQRPISVISNHPNLLSCDPSVCLLPNQVGTTNEYDTKSKIKPGRAGYIPQGLIGDDISFNVTDAEAKDIGAIDYNREGEFGAGFLANIFVNIDLLVDKAETASSLADFLNGVTTDINYSCANVWAFQWRMSDEQPGYLTCVDRNFSWSGKVEALEFGVDNLTSLVRSLSMKSSISSQMTNALYIASNTPFTGATVKKGELSNKNIIPLDVDFEIDGISGLQFGTTLGIDYLPKRYRAQTYLFAKQIQHSISPGSWTTTITAGFRWAPVEAKLNKIRLSQIADNSEVDEEALLVAITGETTNQGEGENQEAVGSGQSQTGKYPGSMFSSLESQGLTMGGDGSDPTQGMEVSTVKDKQFAKEDLIDDQSELMAALYYHGGSVDEVSDANSNLNKIIYYSDQDGTVVPKKEQKAAEKIKRQKVVKSTQRTYTKPADREVTIITNTDVYNREITKVEVDPIPGEQTPLGPDAFF
tara:strand:+ start:992 stop:3691 length:2700 start_codon:yes stop_codon:yes gene_type:complete